MQGQKSNRFDVDGGGVTVLQSVYSIISRGDILTRHSDHSDQCEALFGP